MNIVKADCAGACYGVQRALNLAMEASESAGSVQTLGPLIHNPQVVARLQRRGVTVADGPDDVTADSVIIRSHGVTPQVKAQVDGKGCSVVDATCPHVLRAQNAAHELARAGRTVIVVGERSHPEVEGLRAWAEAAGRGRVLVVASADDLPGRIDEPVGVVVQTTQRRAVLNEVLAALRNRGIDPEVQDTICNATRDRQQAAEDLARTVDAMVVIGGHNSSNTTRLYEICAAAAPKAFHIETPDELKREDFKGVSSVGITAGASTPEDMIDSVIAQLERW